MVLCMPSHTLGMVWLAGMGSSVTLVLNYYYSLLGRHKPIPSVKLAIIYVCQAIPWVQFGYDLHK